MTQFRDEQSFSVQVLAGYVGWHNRGNAMNWALVHVASNGPFPIRSQYHTDTMTLGTNRSRADRRRASRLALEGP
jgi:hypothetical protein